MATTNTTTGPHISDPLLSLRRALTSAHAPPVLTTSPSISTAANSTTTDLTTATHLYVSHPLPQTIPLDTPTRFVSAASGNKPIDLRSIYFAWQKKDVAIPEYIAEAQAINEKVGQDETKKVLNLVFVERLDLITWLEGASEESEYIKPLEGVSAGAALAGAADVAASATMTAATATARAAEDSAKVASGAAGGVPTIPSAGAGGAQTVAGSQSGGRVAKVVDPRLQEIYNGERKMGDRNSVLRGIKPTDFSHVRKIAESFLGRSRSRSGQYPHGGMKPGMKAPIPTSGPGSIPKRSLDSSSSSSRRPTPIILLSPSASSLLRMSNIKSFLSDGVYVPPDHPTLASSTAPNLLYIMRTLQNIPDSSHPSSGGGLGSQSSSLTNPSAARKPTRFIIVDSTADFKPDYWNRVVAVFTTGQTWQFKSYKWSSPPELFKHATGIYVGWRGEDVPRDVKGWGRGVKSFAVDRWDEKSAGSVNASGMGGAGGGGPGGAPGAGGAVPARWRDRGVVEGIWMAIEEGMKARGWGSVK
ncbi:hypothetical protein AJ80_04656 [Polytolypa hystricis UAMH7299]|uniref:Cell division control protein 73 C-terminal domain-containing protein n=1 Tax=Polytolypa hystricis (strain UAMH7299) TaxID=1447883 RepID=A0A2B7Y9W2_POLH7|nr:hypothetical protein AJ80_04656 [Polytolypa hystricis UAMH7299]